MNIKKAERIGRETPRLTWDKIFEETDGNISVNDKAKLNKYFSSFALPPKNDEGKEVCLYCGKILEGGMEGFLKSCLEDWTTLEWGLGWGEAFCGKCHWPYRIYHRDIGGKGDDAVMAHLDSTLPYHPDALIVTKGQENES